MGKIHVELGCGNNIRPEGDGWEDFGLDIVDGDCVTSICNLGFESLPFDDDSVDLFQVIDVLEHIPKCIWSQERKYEGYIESQANCCKIDTAPIIKHVRHLPMIDLINEVYRCLKGGGIFRVEVPFSNWAFDRDPTHVSKFSEDWWHYYKKADNLYYDQGIVTCNFTMILNEKVYDDNTLRTHLKAIKLNKAPLI